MHHRVTDVIKFPDAATMPAIRCVVATTEYTYCTVLLGHVSFNGFYDDVTNNRRKETEQFPLQ